MRLLRSPTRETRSWTTDSRQWAHFKPRPDDIVIATPAKCGTTWMQQIASLLVFQSAEPREIQNASPWIDMRFRGLETMLETIEAQTHRRFLKTHLAFDALPIFDTIRYIHVARDGRDAFMSWHNHSLHYTPQSRELQNITGMADETIGKPLPIPEESPHAFFQVWMTEGPDARLADDMPAARFFEIERSFWAERRRENLLMVHYNDLKSDLAGEMRRIAAFLEIEIPERIWPELVAAAEFSSMKSNGASLMPRAHLGWDKGHERFLNEGKNGRWRDALTAQDLTRYDGRVAREFSPALARWVAEGRLIAGDPRSAAD